MHIKHRDHRAIHREFKKRLLCTQNAKGEEHKMTKACMMTVERTKKNRNCYTQPNQREPLGK